MSQPVFFSGHKRIKTSEVVVRLVESESGKVNVSITASLDHYRFPAGAKIVVEAYDDAYLERLDGGTIERPILEQPQPLAHLKEGQRPKFRLKVVEWEGPDSRRLIASVDQIRPLAGNIDEGDFSLLPLVRKTREQLGHELWRLHVPESHEPELWVNCDVPGLLDRFRYSHAETFALVMPEILRRTLTELFVNCEDDEIDRDDDGPRGRWLKFAERICQSRLDDSEDDSAEGSGGDLDEKSRRRREWVDEVVGAFAGRNQFVDRFIADQEVADGDENA